MSNIQQQETIPLELLDGEKSEATKNGNNAAWLCVCGKNSLPLIWSGYIANRRYNSQENVTCGECEKVYTGEVDSKKFPIKIKEV